MAAIAKPLQLSSRANVGGLSSRSNTSTLASARGLKGAKLGAGAKATKKKAAAANKAKAAKSAAAKIKSADAENMPPQLPSLTLEDLQRTNIYQNIPRLPSSRRVSFSGLSAPSQACTALVPLPTALATITEEDEDVEEGAAPAATSRPTADAPDYAAIKAARRERAAAARAARIARGEVAPVALPTGEDRPAGVGARHALQADSMAARMAARRKEKQNARLQANKLTDILEGRSSVASTAAAASASASVTHLSTDDLDKLKFERQQRVQTLLSQLELLSTGQTMPQTRSRVPLLTHKDHKTTPSNTSTAITSYQGEAVLGGLQAATLVSLLRGEGAQRMAPVARAWLAQAGSADKVRQVLERAPPEYQSSLVSVLARLLSAEDAPEDDVRITILGASAMLNGQGKNTDEERPLPRPIKADEALVGSPSAAASPAGLEVWEADEDGSFTLRV